jgi:hypothetical protein
LCGEETWTWANSYYPVRSMGHTSVQLNQERLHGRGI